MTTPEQKRVNVAIFISQLKQKLQEPHTPAQIKEMRSMLKIAEEEYKNLAGHHYDN